jgi:hypothetical protein
MRWRAYKRAPLLPSHSILLFFGQGSVEPPIFSSSALRSQNNIVLKTRLL